MSSNKDTLRPWVVVDSGPIGYSLGAIEAAWAAVLASSPFAP